jgi:hypothetical protein
MADSMWLAPTYRRSLPVGSAPYASGWRLQPENCIRGVACLVAGGRCDVGVGPQCERLVVVPEVVGHSLDRTPCSSQLEAQKWRSACIPFAAARVVRIPTNSSAGFQMWAVT